MKYKIIKQDKKLANSIKRIGVRQVAERVGISRIYLYNALYDKTTITEKLYYKIKKAVEELL